MTLKINSTIISLILLTVLLVLPMVVLAADASVDGGGGGLVPCGNTADDPCTFKDIFELIGNVIKFLLFTLALPLCALAIVWGGIIIVLNPANPGERAKGLDIIKNAMIGLALALASYLIVDTLLTIFTDQTLQSLQSDQGVTGGVTGNDATIN